MFKMLITNTNIGNLYTNNTIFMKITHKIISDESDIKVFRDGGLKILTKLINTIYKTGQWPPRTSQKLQ